MASDDCRKDELLLEDNRTDSGIDSYRSILKSSSLSEEQQQQQQQPHREPPSTDFSGPPRGDNNKFSSAGEERLDSAYGSSSITVEVESLSEIVGGCSLQEEQNQSSELSEQEEILLTTITEDGDT